jgi:hypothetical protein
METDKVYKISYYIITLKDECDGGMTCHAEIRLENGEFIKGNGMIEFKDNVLDSPAKIKIENNDYIITSYIEQENKEWTNQMIKK